MGDNKPEIFTTVDNRLIDSMFNLRGPQDSSGSVVIIDIDEKSLQDYGQWPWPRSLIADLTEKIAHAEPLSIGFDLMFAEEDRCSPAYLLNHYEHLFTQSSRNKRGELRALISQVPDPDNRLSTILSTSQSVQGYRFLFKEDFQKLAETTPHLKHSLSLTSPEIDFNDVQLISAYRPILNFSPIRAESPEGYLNLFHDKFGTVRKAPLFLLMDNIPYPSLVTEMYQTATGNDSPVLHTEDEKSGKYYPTKGITLGTKYFKTDSFGQIDINFRGPRDTFLYLSASDILNGFAVPLLADKYVLVGSTASGNIDLISTPYSSRLPGVEIHANILDNLIKNDPLIWDQHLEQLLSYGILIVGGTSISLALVFLHPLIGVVLCCLLFTGLGLANYYLLFLENILVGTSFVSALLGTIFFTVTLSNYFFEGKRRSFIKRAFSHYVSPNVINEIMRHPERLDLRVDTREVTVLFCDIRDFTTLAEITPPAELALFLNNYFSLITDIIIHHDGMVDKYMGDAVMAVWGTPLADNQHALKAVQAALDMVEAVNNNRDELLLSGQPIHIGIGINTGLVSAGNFGCSRRFDYTVLGDNVNLASRVEGITKYYPTEILLTKSTCSNVHEFIHCRFVDTVLVKGRNKPVDLFEPLAKSTERSTENALSRYEQAIVYYKNGDFSQAGMLFEKLLESYADPLYEMYLKRCIELQGQPPQDHWDGVYQHSSRSQLV
ncbi:CHASE2 domain-containing protein [Desulforhopalus sp. 52FAK]